MRSVIAGAAAITGMSMCRTQVPQTALRALRVDSIRLEAQERYVPEASDFNGGLRVKLTNDYSETIYLLGYTGYHFWAGLTFDTARLSVPGFEFPKRLPCTIDSIPPHSSSLASLAVRYKSPEHRTALGLRMYRVPADADHSDSSLAAFMRNDTGVIIQAILRDTVF